MQGDVAVIKALNDVFALEVTLFESVHAWEHVFQRRKYRCLRKWYDKEVKRSRDRRRYLTDRCFELDGVLMLQVRPMLFNPSDTPEAIFAATSALAGELLTAYQSAYGTAEKAGDNRTADKLCGHQGDVEDLVLDLEAFTAQIADMGLSEFLGTKAR
jgi:bacterioferritin (cytochrome b1)